MRDSTGTLGELLLAEDDPALAEMFALMLQQCGWRVTIAEDGQDAWESLARSPNRFSVLITDIVMPRLSGDELVRRLRERTMDPPLPVIVITALPRSDPLFERLEAEPGCRVIPKTEVASIARIGDAVSAAVAENRGGRAPTAVNDLTGRRASAPVGWNPFAR